MDQQQTQRSASPQFYKRAAVLFYGIGIVLLVAAVVKRDWVYGAFGAITLLNALMTTLKLISMRETKS